jgi:hypothetical protein
MGFGHPTMQGWLGHSRYCRRWARLPARVLPWREYVLLPALIANRTRPHTSMTLLTATVGGSNCIAIRPGWLPSVSSPEKRNLRELVPEQPSVHLYSAFRSCARHPRYESK